MGQQCSPAQYKQQHGQQKRGSDDFYALIVLRTALVSQLTLPGQEVGQKTARSPFNLNYFTVILQFINAAD